VSAPPVNLIIDDKPVQVPAGTNVIEAAKKAGIEVPHYCYHPRLPIAGNCRMCLVEVGMPKLTPDRKPEIAPDGTPVVMFHPKLAIGCNQPVAEGMVVRTRTPKVIKARQGVMEFLLINHPLDCPICDQAGECRLQEFAVDYGKGESRFVERKNKKPKAVALGEKIMLDVERCILCSRCERFMREVAKSDCLGFMRRGSLNEISAYPGEWPDTNYDLNIVDICPVGALTSTDFRFRQRPWFLKETKSICPHCSTGCNTVVWSREGVVYRQTPRDNGAVNQSWMCDAGRLNYKFINDPARLASPVRHDRSGGQSEDVGWSDAINIIAEKCELIRGSGGVVAGIGSARATTEELYLLRQIVGGETDSVPHSGPGDALLLSRDLCANSNGAAMTGVAAEPAGSRIASIADGIRAGKIRGLIVLGEDVTKHGIGQEVLKKLELLVVIDVLPNETTALADYVLPGATFAEKRGTFVNAQWRMQRLNPAVPSPGNARPEWQILALLLRSLNPARAYQTLDEVFAAMAADQPALAGLTLSKLGDAGVQLDANAVGKEVAAIV